MSTWSLRGFSEIVSLELITLPCPSLCVREPDLASRQRGLSLPSLTTTWGAGIEAFDNRLLRGLSVGELHTPPWCPSCAWCHVSHGVGSRTVCILSAGVAAVRKGGQLVASARLCWDQALWYSIGTVSTWICQGRRCEGPAAGCRLPGPLHVSDSLRWLCWSLEFWHSRQRI